ncbi:hypothetical protein D6779_10575 [Candidatus Parcubacteria bacterium]|nr:MAG: hypothetical protein D6779_10575 [Candidatus Parcubacteria bacterium]
MPPSAKIESRVVMTPHPNRRSENMIDLQTATRDELVAYAKDVKGLDFPKNIPTEKLRARLLGVDVSVDERKEGTTGKGENRVRIVIQQSDEDSTDVFVGVNGRHYLIQRGEEVMVPEHVVEVLRNAKRKVYRTHVDRSTGETTLEEREVLAYPFQILD